KAQSARLTNHTSSMLAHVGYWLVDDGRRTIERELNYRAPFPRRVQRCLRSHPAAAYLGSTAAILVSLLIATTWLMRHQGVSWPVAGCVLIAAFFPLSEIAVSAVNLLVTYLLPPRILPKLELKEGVPAAWRTIVVVPAILTGRKEVAALLD